MSLLLEKSIRFFKAGDRDDDWFTGILKFPEHVEDGLFADWLISVSEDVILAGINLSLDSGDEPVAAMSLHVAFKCLDDTALFKATSFDNDWFLSVRWHYGFATDLVGLRTFQNSPSDRNT
jgi:hypothetical protein